MLAMAICQNSQQRSTTRGSSASCLVLCAFLEEDFVEVGTPSTLRVGRLAAVEPPVAVQDPASGNIGSIGVKFIV